MKPTATRLMRRLDDGKEGLLEISPEGDKRIVFLDRGECLVAGKQEKWVPADLPPAPLRYEEIREVARNADRTLRAFEKHEPLRLWHPIQDDAVHDAGLVDVIVEYLRGRQAP